MLDKNKVIIGISPIGWTNDDLPELGGHIPFEQCISEMSAAGFKACEIGNKFHKDPYELKNALDKYGITAVNEWFPTYFTSRPYEESIELLYKQVEKMKILGGKIIGASEQGNSIQIKPLPVFGKDKPVFTEEQWETVCRGYNEMGKIARDNGLYFAVHHHMGTGIQTEEEIDRLMAMTDPDSVFLTFCIGHVACAGIDPEKLLKKHVKRVKHVHLKDVRANVRKRAMESGMSFLEAVHEGIFTIPGDGSVQYKPLIKLLDENGYEGCLMVEAEQDPGKAPPFEYALRAREFVRVNTGL